MPRLNWRSVDAMTDLKLREVLLESIGCPKTQGWFAEQYPDLYLKEGEEPAPLPASILVGLFEKLVSAGGDECDPDSCMEFEIGIAWGARTAALYQPPFALNCFDDEGNPGHEEAREKLVGVRARWPMIITFQGKECVVTFLGGLSRSRANMTLTKEDLEDAAYIELVEARFIDMEA